MTSALSPVSSAGRLAGTVLEVRSETGGGMAGTVLVSKRDDALLISFTIAHGNPCTNTQHELIEQVFRLPELQVSRQRVLVAIPLGDVELLQCLRARLDEVRARAAGATCLIEATTR